VDGGEGHPAVIREYREDDFEAVTRLWRAARELAFPDFQREKGHTFAEDCDYFRNVILANNDVWAMEVEGRVAGFIAIAGDFVDQFYIHPDFQRRGLGKELLDFAKARSPEHVWLYTLQINANGRAFYEKNGFVAVRFGVSPAPESEPDVEYHWGKDER
jgi:ribosomal protein S18 acetylase RimI-like enzyme